MKITSLALAVLTAAAVTGCTGGAPAKSSTTEEVSRHAQSHYDKPGYVTELHDGRLWVFHAGSKAYNDFKSIGEPAKIVTRIAAGPNGMTIRSTDADVIDGYLLSRPGYVAEVHDARLWVFKAGSKDYDDFKKIGEPAKIVTRIAAGPNGMTLRATSAETIDGYLAAGK